MMTATIKVTKPPNKSGTNKDRMLSTMKPVINKNVRILNALKMMVMIEKTMPIILNER